MSTDLVWLLTRNNSSFLVKRNGVQFSREPGNLLNINSLKYSGVAPHKNVDVAATDKGVVLSLRKKGAANKPVKSLHQVTLTTGARSAARSVKNVVKGYRPDLEKAALARVSRLLEVKKGGKVYKPRKLRGAKARKAASQ
ncbi:60S ribosomal protein L28 [Borealophlyctis nickersoniae]|nr:60S ribosomal protein L28 [Borealophlyctis nickersoniae]